MTVPPSDPYPSQPGYGPPAYGQQPYSSPGNGQLPAYGQQQPYGQPYPQPGYGGYPPAPYGRPELATYGQRVAGYLIDGGAPALVYILVVAISAGSGRIGVILTVYALASIALLAFVIWNSGYRQGTTGQSIGKKVVGIKLVGLATGQPVGFGLAIGRQFAHIIDGIPFYLGYLWPLWDEQRQTFADKVCNTLVVNAGVVRADR